MATIEPKIISALKSMRPGLRDAALATPHGMTREEFLILQELAEQFDADHAQGRDFAGAGTLEQQEGLFRGLQQAVAQLLDAAPWTLHPDHGCVLAADVDALDGGARRQRFTVKMVAPDGRVVGQERFSAADEAMRAYSVRRRSQFGREFGAGAYVALVDDESQFDASYMHEGMQTYREQFAKEQGRELAIAVQREDLTSPERSVEVATATLTDERLDWAVAEALEYRISGEEPTWVSGKQQFGVAGMDVTGAPLFSPSANPLHAQQLIESEGIGTQKIRNGHWRGTSEDGSAVADGPNMLTAGLRALVMHYRGESVRVPAALPERRCSDEPVLVDKVIMERVAAHYTDYFCGPVHCSYYLSDSGVEQKHKFAISGSVLPAHPGNRGDGPKLWSMSDVVSRRQAVAIAEAYPAIRDERVDRADVILGRKDAWVPNAVVAAAEALQALKTAAASRDQDRGATFWSEVQWSAATDLLASKVHSPEVIANAMAYFSPACVLDKEKDNLTTWLSSELSRQQALAALRESPESSQVAAP